MSLSSGTCCTSVSPGIVTDSPLVCLAIWLVVMSFILLPPSPTPVRSLLERLGDELSLLPPQQLLIPPAMQRPLLLKWHKVHLLYVNNLLNFMKSFCCFTKGNITIQIPPFMKSLALGTLDLAD